MEKLDVKIHIKVAIKASSENIYPLITTAKGWDSWFTRGTVFNLEKKGEVLFSWKNWGADKVTESEKATVQDFDQNRYLQFDWNYFIPGGPTNVEILLTRHSEFTIVEVIQTGFPNNKEGLSMYGQCSSGWSEALTLLKIYVEHGISYN